jgi:signal transduction histidine kinase/ActR/RegA family two-component response regulator
MLITPRQTDEILRQIALNELGVLDTPPDEELNALVQVASIVCGKPIALISLVDADRQWFKANLGLPGVVETPRTQAFCAHTIQQDDIMEVTDAQQDGRFADNPLVTGEPGIRFYAGAPLRLMDGSQVGSLCVIGREPAQLTPMQREVLRSLGFAASRALEKDLRARRAQEAASQDLRVANAELSKLAYDLAQARQLADQASLAKTRFLAGMSHELRTPLNGILGYAQLMQMDSDLTPGQSRQVSAMLDAGQHLLEMISGVLDLSAIESGSVTLQPALVDVPTLVQACATIVRPTAEARKLRLEVAIAPDAPRCISTDPARLRQVLLNLLGNAVKFTLHGGVTLRLTATANRAGLRFEVADTGPGIPRAKIHRLFGEFDRLDSGSAGQMEGAGLGLSIARRLADLMGGQLGHLDNPGGGSIFWLEVPLESPGLAAPIVNPALAPPPPGAAPTAAASTAPLILVVDDVAMSRDIAASFVRTAGYRTVCAAGGAEAVTAAAAGSLAMVLMDVCMPDMDGLEATRRIRALEGARGQVPIVAVTSQNGPSHVAACLEAGMQDHVAKPFTLDSLLAAVRRRMSAAAD